MKYLFFIYCILAALATQSQTPALNKKRIISFLENYPSSATDSIGSFIAPDCMDHMLPSNSTNGLDGIKKHFSENIEGFPDGKFAIVQMLAEADLVSVYSIYNATNTGTLRNKPATGRRVSIPCMDIYRFNKNGLCTEHWAVHDIQVFISQIYLQSHDTK